MTAEQAKKLVAIIDRLETLKHQIGDLGMRVGVTDEEEKDLDWADNRLSGVLNVLVERKIKIERAASQHSS